MRALIPLLALFAVACTSSGDGDDKSVGDDTGLPSSTDGDGDGFDVEADCDDGDAEVNPDAAERCDGVDNNCDGVTDGADAVDAGTWYIDGDQDGFGDDSTAQVICPPGAGFVDVGGDCDDSNVAYQPGAPETDCADPNDYNCDGSVGYDDNDSDGVAACEDCDDDDPFLSVSSPEVCDGADNDCDGQIDDEASDATTYYRDADSDSYGDPDFSERDCEQPPGYVADDADCDDTDAAINPKTVWYLDFDSDGYGNPSFSLTQCEQPSGYLLNDQDCDDSDATLNPTTVWYTDSDGDSHGGGTSVSQCAAPSKGVRTGGDCDDAKATTYPGAAEKCDTVDSDCDGDSRDPESSDASTFYQDSDGDGYGDAGSTTKDCDLPTGYSSDDTDCADGDGDAYPGSHETETSGDGIDTDCDGNDDCDDLNCDGYPDIIFAAYYDGSSYNLSSPIFYGSATGYSSADSDTLPAAGGRRPEVQDIDGDGYLDILLISHYDGNYSTDSHIYWGSPAGYSSSDKTDLAGLGAIDVCIEDLDSDGYKDIVLANYQNSGDYTIDSYIYWGSSSGYSTSDRTDVPTAGARECAIADFDKDGYPDIAFANYYDGSNSTEDQFIYWGSSAGYSSSDRQSLTTARSAHLEVEDVNQDGWMDILWVGYYDGDYGTNSDLYYGGSSGFSSANRYRFAGYGEWDAVIEDLDLDGHLDVAFASYYSGSAHTSSYSYVYYGATSGFSTSNRTTLGSIGGRFITADDLDGDGYPELVHSNNRSSNSDYTVNSYVYRGSASGFSTSRRYELPTESTYRHATADLDGDGYKEIIFSNYYDGSSYAVDSYIYWGSSSGYSSSDRTDLPVNGAWGEPVVVGSAD